MYELVYIMYTNMKLSLLVARPQKDVHMKDHRSFVNKKI